ncbi:hypothetical protein B0H16DRAFT_1669634 [Mycena metata]|uniref:NAD(P)-binding protein n=1 Tax=Mycena metata TaxID=1033252 RepID=A0AAD7DJ03_9AGAR|nr:hypothetical protein B0H16DRAFT_1669634 [Mycena metata]
MICAALAEPRVAPTQISGGSSRTSFSPSGALDPADTHPGRVAVITGAASGIGAAAARLLASLHHMKVALADLPANLAADLKGIVCEGNVLVVPTDVRVVAEVERLRERVYKAWSEVGVLMHNAGVDGKGTSWDGLDAWHDVFAVNLFGVVNVQQVFGPAMLHQENPAMVINTGSKQGITNPPCVRISSFLPAFPPQFRSSPGYTFTGLTGQHDGAEKPPGAWTAEETVRHMLERVAKGDFYVLCPDGNTGPEIDQLRIMWAAADVAQGRPALSRWHRDYKALFEEYMREGQALAQEGALML